MQVNDIRKKRDIPFELVERGEVFCWEGKLWMRTGLCKVGDTLCNTVNIADGMLVYFADSDCVEELDTELIIH